MNGIASASGGPHITVWTEEGALWLARHEPG